MALSITPGSISGSIIKLFNDDFSPILARNKYMNQK